MTLVDMIRAESKNVRFGILVVATFAGLSNVGALMLVNSVVHAPQTATATNFLAYVAAAFTSLLATRISAHRLSTIIENALHHAKARLVEKIERAGFQRLERMGPTLILDRITANMTVISVATAGLSFVLPTACMLVFGVIYFVSVSPTACLIVLPLQLGCVYLYRTQIVTLHPLLNGRAQLRVRFLDALMGLLRGAKEIRLNEARAQGVLQEYVHESGTLKQMSTRVNKLFDDNAVFATVNRYALLGALAFVVPQHVALDGAHVAKLVAATLFLWGSVQALLDVSLAYVRANDAIANIDELERHLEGAKKLPTSSAASPDPWNGRLGPIRLSHVEYTYEAKNDEHPFHLGPIDLTIQPGEVIFLVGGNGSGKSTLLKVLTGLYPPAQGTLEVEGTAVHAPNAEHYREMISVIFADFHLFSKAYGLLEADPTAVEALLRDMHIDHKTSFQNGEFTHQKLSTGQKKRLAMVIALLDDRPFFVLDEWAADQDPEFRKHFYEQMIPALKRKGKTIVAVSHDDRYFHIADRVVVMEYGQIRSITPQAPQGA